MVIVIMCPLSPSKTGSTQKRGVGRKQEREKERERERKKERKKEREREQRTESKREDDDERPCGLWPPCAKWSASHATWTPVRKTEVKREERNAGMREPRGAKHTG